MDNLNFPYVAILYVNSCPVGFIDRLGFIVPQFNYDCRFFLTQKNFLTIPYSPKSDKHESIRTYRFSYFYSDTPLTCEFVEKNFPRIEKQMEFLSADIVMQKRKSMARAVSSREIYFSSINDD